jgi:hypothetical protein
MLGRVLTEAGRLLGAPTTTGVLGGGPVVLPGDGLGVPKEATLLLLCIILVR